MFTYNNHQTRQSFICTRGFFPSIRSPKHKRTIHSKNKTLSINHDNISQTLSPRSLQKSQKINQSFITKQQRVVSNFLLKYLTRKQLQQQKWNTMNNFVQQQTLSSCIPNNNKNNSNVNINHTQIEQKKIDPRFRRVYLKKLKKSNQNKREQNFISTCRFMIGDEKRYSRLQKYSMTIDDCIVEKEDV